MSHDDINTADDRAVARALLGYAVIVEPPLDMDLRMLRRAARRRQSRRPASTTLGVIAAAVGAAVLVRHHENVPITAPIPGLGAEMAHRRTAGRVVSGGVRRQLGRTPTAGQPAGTTIEG